MNVTLFPAKQPFNGQPSSNDTEKEPIMPLNVAIAGAGIGGLTAAIALRRQGHNVTLYEASSDSNEVGAAIHLAPNSNGILRRYGIFAEELGASHNSGMTQYNENGEITQRIDLRKPNEMWQHPWQLVHRVRLHEKLKRTALSKDYVGPPAVLKNSSKVVSIDTNSGTFTLEDGTLISKDVMIGADGIYSKTRSFVSGQSNKLFGSGKAAFRFMIARKDVQADPMCAKYAQREDELCIWYAEDRRLVMYPVNDNELLNFVGIHPEAESHGDGAEWSLRAEISQMLKVYRNFDAGTQALLKKADPESLKVWKLLDMEVLPEWTKGKVALLGDAAHPFLPHQGQGGGMAIEDAASIAVCLPLGTKPEEVSERLRLYQEIRKTRADRLQEFSRQAGLDHKGGKPAVDMIAYTMYNFGHDEIDNSTNKFQKWWRANNPDLCSRMPIAFSPSPGPRQNIIGNPRSSLDQTFRTASIKFKTSRTFLQSLFPTEFFSFKSPGTVCYASFSTTTFGKVAGECGGYSDFGLYIHGITYTKKDGSTIDGTYVPILLENLADTVNSGRDELGMPNLRCQIDIDAPGDASSYKIQASWQGNIFAEFDLENLVPLDASTEKGTIDGESESDILVYRYVSKVGKSVKAQPHCECAVILPHSEESRKSTVTSVAKASKASIKFDKMDDRRLPTLHHVVSTLADIPIYEIIGVKVVEGTGAPEVSAARRNE